METMVRVKRHLTSSLFFLLFILVCVVLFCGSHVARSAPTDYYVDFHYTGQEDGSNAQPFNTLNEAVAKAKCADTILIKPGFYEISKQDSSSIEIKRFQECGQCSIDSNSERLTITVAEDGNNKVVFKAIGDFRSSSFFRIVNNQCIYLNGDNRFLIDGSDANIKKNDSLVSISSYKDTIHDIVFENFEVTNSTGRGVSFRMDIDSPPGNIILRKNKIHSIAYRSLGGFGNGVRMEENEIWNSALSNLYQAFGAGGWPGVIQMARNYDKDDDQYHYSENIYVNNNYIHDNWGEGIIMSFILNGEATGNRIQDVFSVYLYIDNAMNIQVSGNHLFRTTNSFDRNDKAVGAPNGIAMAQESYSWGNHQTPFTLQNITISNNLIDNLGKGISYWHDSENTSTGNSYSNISIIHNILRNIQLTPIQIYRVPGNYSRPSNGHIHNNIIENLATTPLRTLRIGDDNVWSYSHNNWTGGLPSHSQHPNSHAHSSGFVGPDFSIGAHPSNFCLADNGKNIRAGTAVSSTKDYWGTRRDSQAPSIGIHEYQEPVPADHAETTKILDGK